MKAHQMTADGIAKEILAGLDLLQSDGKDLTNDWDFATLSFPGIEGGEYNPAYGHGGAEDIRTTVLRMSRTGPPSTHRPTLETFVSAMRNVIVQLDTDKYPKEVADMLSKYRQSIEVYYLR